MKLPTGAWAVYEQKSTDYSGNITKAKINLAAIKKTANSRWCEMSINQNGQVVRIMKGLFMDNGDLKEFIIQEKNKPPEKWPVPVGQDKQKDHWVEKERTKEKLIVKAGTFDCEHIILVREAETSTQAGNLKMTVRTEFTFEKWISNSPEFKGLVKEIKTWHMTKNVRHKLDPTRTYPTMKKDKTSTEITELIEFHPQGAVSKITTH